MDAPWNYDENGVPKDEETRTKIREREEYVCWIKKFEDSRKLPQTLSSVLRNHTLTDGGREGTLNPRISWDDGALVMRS
jgi:hypothetical protein